ncbi:MAG: ankyrin repeat domain-containing protein [Acidimicrobiales bacterium]
MGPTYMTDHAEHPELFEAIEAGDGARVAQIVADDPPAASARNPAGLSAVLAAMYRHRRDLVDVLLAGAPELDVFDAAAVGDVDRLSELLDGDPSRATAYSNDGFFPLALAAYFAQPDAVRVILERGADVGATTRNAMALQPLLAAAHGDDEIVDFLLTHGGQVDLAGEDGRDPATMAEDGGHADLAARLRNLSP